MTCQHCVNADAAARRAYRGTLKVLRAERTASRDPKVRNAKLRAIKRILTHLAQPEPTGPCTWHPKGGRRADR